MFGVCLLQEGVGRRREKMTKLHFTRQTSNVFEEARMKEEGISFSLLKKHLQMHFSGISACGVTLKTTAQHALLLKAVASAFVNGSSNEQN